MLVVFLALAALAVIVDHPWDERSPSKRRLVAFGGLAALAAVTRSQAVLLIIPLVIALALPRRGWRSTLAGSAVALVAMVVTIAPVTIRNAITMDAFIPISTNTGDDLCIGHNPSATGAFALSKECLAIKDFRGGHSEVQRDRDNTSKALHYAWAHPRREFELTVQRARFTYDGDY